MIRAIIVDDEHKSREFLHMMLHEIAPEIDIVGKAKSADEGIELIRSKKPNLVFLDIQMAGGNGFDMLERYGPADFQVIFVTGHNEFALQAFKVSALDYLSKPVGEKDLLRAIGKAKQAINSQGNQFPQSEQLKALLENINGSDPRKSKLCLPEMHGFTMVESDAIIRIESDGSYSRIFLNSGKDILITRTLGDIEDRLNPSVFVRVHRSHIISVDYIGSIVKAKAPLIEMSDGFSIAISRRKKQEVFDKLNHV